MSRRVPDLLVEKLHFGELSPDEAKRVRARLEAEDGGLARLAALVESDRELGARLPLRPTAATRSTDEIAMGGHQRPGLRVSATRRWLAPALAFGALVLAFAIAWPLVDTPDARDPLRAKGGSQLIIYRLAARGPELLNHGALAQEGDRLQLSARLAEEAHLAILSVDGLGVVTVHQPPTDSKVHELQVPSSFVLDEAPRFERFFLFVSPAPIAVEPLVRALERLSAPGGSELMLEVPPAVLFQELRLDKPAAK